MATKKELISFAFNSVGKSLLVGKLHSRKFIQSINIIKNIITGEIRREKNQKKYSSLIPPICIFSVTWLCNLKCIGCYAKNYDKKKLLSPLEIEKILRELISYGTYIFIIAGGEPLIVPDIINIMGRLKKGIFFLFTNGTMINKGKVKQIGKYKNIIPIVSIEGDNTTTNKRRGKNVYQKIENTLLLFKEYKIPYGFSTMATHQNLKYIVSYEYLNNMIEKGAVFGFIIDYIPFPFSLDEKLILTEDDNDFKKSELAKRKIDTRLPIFNFPSDEYSNGTCESAGKGFIHVNANGNVEPCPFSHYAHDNILNSDYISILNSEFFIKIRERYHSVKNHGQCLLFKYSNEVERLAFETGGFKTEV